MIQSLVHRCRGLRLALLTLAMLAMMVRALTPQGFMLAPTQSDGQWIAIQLCSGHGPVAALIDLKTGAIVDEAAMQASGSGKTPQKSDAPCLFAAVANLAVPVMAFVAVKVILKALPIQTAHSTLAPGLGLAAPPPWGTGPPTFN